MGASGDIGDVGVLWAVVLGYVLDVGVGSIVELARAGGGCWSRSVVDGCWMMYWANCGARVSLLEI